MVHRYTTHNGPAPTTAAQQAVTTGTTIKTMLQLATPSTRQIRIIAWGFSLDDPPGGDNAVREAAHKRLSQKTTRHDECWLKVETAG